MSVSKAERCFVFPVFINAVWLCVIMPLGFVRGPDCDVSVFTAGAYGSSPHVFFNMPVFIQTGPVTLIVHPPADGCIGCCVEH